MAKLQNPSIVIRLCCDNLGAKCSCNLFIVWGLGIVNFCDLSFFMQPGSKLQLQQLPFVSRSIWFCFLSEDGQGGRQMFFHFVVSSEA